VRTAAWTGFVVLLAVAAWLAAAASPFVRMLAFVASTFLGIKLVVLATARGEGVRLSRTQLGWFLVWFGMNPRTFLRRRDAVVDARGRRWRRTGFGNLLAGTVLIAGSSTLPPAAGYVVLVVGLSVVLHFGLLTLLAAEMRGRGFAVPLLFDAPWRARTAAEFWSRRWNHGFAEMTSLLVQRPFRKRLGAERARLLSFLWSGVLHEIALSWPVRAGWGLPTCYFVLQGLVVHWQGQRPSRLVTFAALLLPAPLLFHPWFLRGVLGPWLA
jgi:hypothetical protein